MHKIYAQQNDESKYCTLHVCHLNKLNLILLFFLPLTETPTRSISIVKCNFNVIFYSRFPYYPDVATFFFFLLLLVAAVVCECGEENCISTLSRAELSPEGEKAEKGRSCIQKKICNFIWELHFVYILHIHHPHLSLSRLSWIMWIYRFHSFPIVARWKTSKLTCWRTQIHILKSCRIDVEFLSQQHNNDERENWNWKLMTNGKVLSSPSHGDMAK